MVEGEVVFVVRGSAGWARINRPDQLNCISPAVLDGLDGILDRVESDGSVTCLVLTGTGRAFCAGADLKFIGDLQEQERDAATDAFIARVLKLMERIEAFPKPVIGAINGIATGGGLELALCCDLVYAAASAKIGDGHANFGLIPGGGGTVRLPRKIGLNRAKYLLFTGDLLPAGILASWGLVNEVAADEALDSEVQALADKLATKSPLGLQRMKLLADGAYDCPAPQAMMAERTMSALHVRSFDCQEGIAAFKEARKPVFQGR